MVRFDFFFFTVPGQVFWSTLCYQIRDGGLVGGAGGMDYMHGGKEIEARQLYPLAYFTHVLEHT